MLKMTRYLYVEEKQTGLKNNQIQFTRIVHSQYNNLECPKRQKNQKTKLVY